MSLENIYGCGLAELFEVKLYRRIGAEADGYFNTDRFGFPITEGQLSLRLRDFARLAMLAGNEGKNTAGEQVLPATFTTRLTRIDPQAQNAYHAQTRDEVFPRGQYKEQFWILDPGKRQFAMLGIHGQFAWYDLERKLLLVGFGSYPLQDGLLKMTALNTLWQTIAEEL
jgi:CubicO group peptidase (beta-lactamase class C family)